MNKKNKVEKSGRKNSMFWKRWSRGRYWSWYLYWWSYD